MGWPSTAVCVARSVVNRKLMRVCMPIIRVPKRTSVNYYHNDPMDHLILARRTRLQELTEDSAWYVKFWAIFGTVVGSSWYYVCHCQKQQDDSRDAIIATDPGINPEWNRQLGYDHRSSMFSYMRFIYEDHPQSDYYGCPCGRHIQFSSSDYWPYYDIPMEHFGFTMPIHSYPLEDSLRKLPPVLVEKCKAEAK